MIRGLILKVSMDGSSAYDRYVKVEISAGKYVYLGIVGKLTEYYIRGGTQIWVADDVRDAMNWSTAETAAQDLPQ